MSSFQSSLQFRSPIQSPLKFMSSLLISFQSRSPFLSFQSGGHKLRPGGLPPCRKIQKKDPYAVDQWFSNFLHQVPPQKIFGFPSTTIMTNIKMQYKWLPTAPGVCSRCVCVCVCVCTLDGLNAEHKFRVCHVTFTFSSTIHSKKKKYIYFFFKRVSFNPYKNIYYCQPLKI